MIPIPRNATLCEALYTDIDKDEYLLEIYDNLLYNYAVSLMKSDQPQREIPRKHALRFSDILAKSTYPPTADRDRTWGQEIAILLRHLYPEDESVKYYLGSALSAVGNYRGLQSKPVEGFEHVDFQDQIFYEYDKSVHAVPGTDENEYFFHDQLTVYQGLDEKFFSYSGPTSMGKSFVVQTYIQQQILNGSTRNYAILVPTKALINEIKENMFKALKKTLIQTNYRIVTSSGDIVLQQDHHFVFIMTPERLLHMMIERADIPLDFLFIDEAHKISERGGRSTYYYKVLSQLSQRKTMPTVVFASPNIPNPSIYLNIIPGLQNAHARKLASRYTPVCQFKFFLDFPSRTGYYHNPISKELQQCCSIPEEYTLADMVDLIGHDSQNIIYCNSRKSVLDNAIEYARHIAPKNDETLNSLAAEIKREVHNDCYLADLIVRGIAYHVGYLPNSIRLRIEQSFERGDIRTIFCTSTLVEGVNLPADNMFITSYKDGLGNMNEVEFRNLVGRIGRIKYNLYGNVFLVRMNEKQRSERYIELLNKEVPEQELSINIKHNKDHIDTLIRDLANGDIEMSGCRKEATDQDYDALRKFGLILTRDLARGDNTPVLQAVSPHLTAETVEKIKQNFPQDRTSDDITLSYDQTVNLQQGISSGTLEYPTLTGEEEDFENIVDFLWKLRELFKWEIYEKETIGRRGKYQKDSVIRWYATILLQWLRGNGLNAIVYHGIKFKEQHPETGVWSGNHLVAERYNPKSKYMKNLVIAESLSTIENVLLFSFSNYFRKFSLEYDSFSGGPNPDNDWYVFVEYGTMNQHSIFLQKSGFSREATIYIQNPKNYEKYVVEVDGETKIKRSIMECGNTIVENDAKFIQYNLPELFCDDEDTDDE